MPIEKNAARKIDVLIVDDEPDIRELLEITLRRMQLTTHTAENLTVAIQRLQQNHYQLCLTDMRLPDGNGIELVNYVQKHKPQMPIAIITAHGSIDFAIQALKAGAFDFISKPVDLTHLRTIIEKALQLDHATETTTLPLQLIGHSPALQQLEQQIHRLARSQAPVYISGESGSGKELVARMIHYLSARKNGPFVPVNCGAIPSELMESEFFGHKKGSFTGAIEDNRGLFQAAQGGTLFLDEVADLPLAMQVKLLRAIQEKQIRPIGEAKEISVDVRIVSATHKNLQQLVQENLFRQDLFYRINVIQIWVPPLRQRIEDIHPLTEYFLQRLAKNWHLSKYPKLSDAAYRALENYYFPGNVRELENILERALTLCDTEIILPEHLQLPTMTTASATLVSQDAVQQAHTQSLETYLSDIEKEVIIKTLEATHWNRTTAAKRLGMTFRSLRYRLKKLGIDTHLEEE